MVVFLSRSARDKDGRVVEMSRSLREYVESAGLTQSIAVDMEETFGAAPINSQRRGRGASSPQLPKPQRNGR